MTLKFDIYTLVDITETRARRGDDPVAYKQQQNYLTVLQTIGLRVNPTVHKPPALTDQKLKFGSVHKNVDRVWKLSIEIEYEDALSEEMLTDDFELVPFISGLSETAKFKDDVFVTKDTKHQNIIFVQTDKY